MDVNVLIDRREDVEMRRLLPCRVADLKYGDYCFYGEGANGPITVGIERKKVGDMLNSISTGRFSGHQLPGLLSTYDRVYLIVEGEWTQYRGMLAVRGEIRSHNIRGRHFTNRDLMSFFTTMEETGVNVRITSGISETVDTIMSLYAWWGKEWGKHTSHVGMRKDPTLTSTRASLIERIAAELPGVGRKRARVVGKAFNSIEDMVLASEEEWKMVEGVGKITAHNIYESIRRRRTWE